MVVISAPISFLSPSFSRSSVSSLSSSNSVFFTNGALLPVLRQNQTKQVKVKTRKSLSCTCLFGLGVPELVVIAGVAALVFGPKQLPEVGRNIGKTVKSFQQAAKEFETELKKEPDLIPDPPAEKPTMAVSEDTKEDSSIKDSV